MYTELANRVLKQGRKKKEERRKKKEERKKKKKKEEGSIFENGGRLVRNVYIHSSHISM